IKYSAKPKLAEYISFNVIGCPESRDIDLVVVMKNKVDVKELIDLEKLKGELVLLGYDINRELDINQIYIQEEDGKLQQSSKGAPNETQNIIYYTYKHHKQ